MAAATSFLIILFLSLLVVRVATVALMYTGLSKEAARFQARSAVTGTGFTTGESEMIVRHPVRRRIVSLLMLLQSAGLVTATSSLILSFTNVEQSQDGLIRLLMMLAGLIVLWALASSHWVELRLQRIIGWALEKWTKLETRDYLSLLHLAENYRVTEIAIRDGDWLADRTLGELELPEEGCLVLGIQRRDGTFVGAPQSDTLIRAGDVLLVYGRLERINELDTRRAGMSGEKAREAAVEEHESVVQEQQQREASEDEEKD